MTEEKRHWYRGPSGAPLTGAIWFMGWLFTIGYGNLVWWKILLGIIIWPYFLGVAVR